VVALLISKGADINAKSYSLSTPLHYAALFGQTEMAALLISKGSDRNALDKDQLTPAMLAEKRGYPKLGEMIRKAAARSTALLK
jgi:ankyrin repeat protein